MQVGEIGFTTRALQRAPWNDARDPLEGVILHAAGA